MTCTRVYIIPHAVVQEVLGAVNFLSILGVHAHAVQGNPRTAPSRTLQMNLSSCTFEKTEMSLHCQVTKVDIKVIVHSR